MYVIIGYGIQENFLLCSLSVSIIKDTGQNVKKINDENRQQDKWPFFMN
jgi:hypothetical protein